MGIITKHFQELTIEELWEIYRLRAEVFVVEQECIYQDVDVYDKVSYHIYMRDGDGMYAYARVLPPHTTFEHASIGRVISQKRRRGIGTQIVAAAIETACDKFGAEKITIEVQVYARQLYEKLGFVQVSEEFLEDGIPHMKMEWKNIN